MPRRDRGDGSEGPGGDRFGPPRTRAGRARPASGEDQGRGTGPAPGGGRGRAPAGPGRGRPVRGTGPRSRPRPVRDESGEEGEAEGRGPAWRGLDDGGSRIVYGVNPVREAFRAGRVVHDLYVREGRRRLVEEVEAKGRAGNLHVVSAEELARLSGSREHQGIAARVEAIENASVNHLVRTKGRDLLVLVLDGVQDPHNLGAAYRVADGAGVDLVIATARDSASIQLGSVAKASAGAVEHVPSLVVGDLGRCLDELVEHGFTVVGLEAGEGEPLGSAPLTWPVALVLGGEGSGIRGRTLDHCTVKAHLPLRGRVNSLNVSVAAAVAAFRIADSRPGATVPVEPPEAVLPIRPSGEDPPSGERD